MHPAYIKAEIEIAGLTHKQIAEEYGCSEVFVGKVIKEGKGSEPLMKFICKKINKSIDQVFPAWVNRKIRRPRRKL